MVLSDIQIRLIKADRLLSSEEKKELTDTILEVESYISRIERKGLPFKEFLALKNSEGKLPRFQVNLFDGPRFAYSEDEFVALRQMEEENQRLRHIETLASIPDEEINEEMRIFKPGRIHFVELYEEEGLNNIESCLSKFGFTLDKYLISDGALLDVIEDGGATIKPFHTLHEVIEYLRENGRKGIEIQRYKGLGEMNADQLWETTMDPTKRTLVKVTLPDIIAADHMFSMLMGEDVPPRRSFIEQYALSVKNLDI